MCKQNQCKYRMLPFISTFSYIGRPVFERALWLPQKPRAIHATHSVEKCVEWIQCTFFLSPTTLYTEISMLCFNYKYAIWKVKYKSLFQPGLCNCNNFRYLHRNLCRYFPHDLNASVVAAQYYVTIKRLHVQFPRLLHGTSKQTPQHRLFSKLFIDIHNLDGKDACWIPGRL